MGFTLVLLLTSGCVTSLLRVCYINYKKSYEDRFDSKLCCPEKHSFSRLRLGIWGSFWIVCDVIEEAIVKLGPSQPFSLKAHTPKLSSVDMATWNLSWTWRGSWLCAWSRSGRDLWGEARLSPLASPCRWSPNPSPWCRKLFTLRSWPVNSLALSLPTHRLSYFWWPPQLPFPCFGVTIPL